MECPTYFEDFLAKVRLTDRQAEDLRTGHTTLVERLKADRELEPAVVSIFLQGSYRRGTIVRPHGEKKSDVDIVVVTRLSHEDHTPAQAIARFVPFVNKYYPGKYVLQGRSIGIELSYVSLDLVVTAAPSEQQEGILKSASVKNQYSLEDASDWRLSESWLPENERKSWNYKLVEKVLNEAEWQAEPLLIPDREANIWAPTHPLEQMRWTRDKNKRCNGHFINVVKALKWWQRTHNSLPKHPKGYPFERIIAECCPDNIETVAEGITEALEDIRDRFAEDVHLGRTPELKDHGTGQSVLKRISPADFSTFYSEIKKAASVARAALNSEELYESAKLWRELLGDNFELPPEPKKGSGGSTISGGFVPPSSPATPKDSGRYG